MLGNNYQGKDELRSKTVTLYAEAVNLLFTLRGFHPPIDFSDPNNEGAQLILNLAAQETIANQREPLTNPIMAKLLEMARDSHPNSAIRAVANVAAICRYLGCRVSEYAQKTQTKIDYHVYPSGLRVIKAFLLTDWVFFDEKGTRLSIAPFTNRPMSEIYDQIDHMSVTWRIQKNRQNGQSLKLKVDRANEPLCPIKNALEIVLRKLRIDRARLATPLCVFTKEAHSTNALYLTARKVAEVIQKAVKAVHPNISKKELSRYTAHSFRVWAAVLLDEQGKQPTFIKSRLRWMGDSFMLYLRDTMKMNELHREALSSESSAIVDLVTILNEGSTTDTASMGNYQDDMD
eukprot:scaffold5758_cov69-Skeletonema_marinoi.AAC.4